MLVVDITADQPDIPRQLVVEYLRSAADVVSRPVPVPEQRAKMYAAAYLLLRKAYKHAPELTSPVSAAMQSLAQDVPREMTYDATYKNLELGPKQSLDEMLREIGKASDAGHRDAQYLALVYDLWRQSDFTNAAKVNDKISDTDARGHLETIINFGRAARLQEKGDGDSVAQAEGVGARLSPGLERAVLMLAIAGARARGRDSQRAAEVLGAVRTEISKVGSSHRPYLLIEAAGLGAAQSDVALALSALNEAVRQLNAQKAEDPDPVWKRHVKVGGLWRDFPLSVKGVNFELSRPLRALAKLDLRGTTSSVRALDNEELLARVLPALAEGMLR